MNVKKLSMLFLVGATLLISSASFAAGESLEEESPAKEKCHGYCLSSFVGLVNGNYIFEAEKCNNCESVTIRCPDDHFLDGSACQNCKGACPGHDYANCAEISKEELQQLMIHR